MGSNLMIVEDDTRMRMLLAYYFKKEGFNVWEANDGREALRKFKKLDLNIIIVDIMLPNMDGWTLCREIRKISDIPIIILTALAEDEDMVYGFELGADDYVTKPFTPRVLIARTKAVMKRSSVKRYGDGCIKLGDLCINDTAHEVTLEGKPLFLSPREYSLLFYLANNVNKILSREKILDAVWGYSYEGDLRTVDTHIWRLREKLQDSCCRIITVRGFGYKFEVNE